MRICSCAKINVRKDDLPLIVSPYGLTKVEILAKQSGIKTGAITKGDHGNECIVRIRAWTRILCSHHYYSAPSNRSTFGRSMIMVLSELWNPPLHMLIRTSCDVTP
jgi:hypothetical protein